MLFHVLQTHSAPHPSQCRWIVRSHCYRSIKFRITQFFYLLRFPISRFIPWISVNLSTLLNSPIYPVSQPRINRLSLNKTSKKNNK